MTLEKSQVCWYIGRFKLNAFKIDTPTDPKSPPDNWLLQTLALERGRPVVDHTK